MAKYESMYILCVLYSSLNDSAIHAKMETISKGCLEGLVCYINFPTNKLKL